MAAYPESLAIAGAWGYIGQKFLEAARRRRIRTLVFDPGDPPEDLRLESLTRVTSEEEFYASQADLFHLAMHPEQRQRGLDLLSSRSARGEEIAVLNEKPMAPPENPEQCIALVERAEQTRTLMLFDFPELFDPLTERILDHLSRFRDLRISDIYVQRSKDRENAANARNHKRMVPIQYQESVHCLAFVIYVLGRLRGDLAGVFQRGVTITGDSKPYRPPNPKIYPYVVDGRCNYHLALGPIRIDGETNFKTGADGTKQRVICGTGDGRPFRIEVNFQEGQKRLVVDGVDRTADPAANSYDQVLRTFTSWRRSRSREELMAGIFPNPSFARITYQLSSVLWRCCHDHKAVQLASLDELLDFDAGFLDAVPSFDKYV